MSFIYANEVSDSLLSIQMSSIHANEVSDSLLSIQMSYKYANGGNWLIVINSNVYTQMRYLTHWYQFRFLGIYSKWGSRLIVSNSPVFIHANEVSDSLLSIPYRTSIYPYEVSDSFYQYKCQFHTCKWAIWHTGYYCNYIQVVHRQFTYST